MSRGYESFPSVESAQEYLDSETHLNAVKKRAEEEEQRKRDGLYHDCVVKKIARLKHQDCDKLKAKLIPQIDSKKPAEK